jgi:uncharacterized membrane protein YbhN (UPF0104 family)
LSRWGRLAAGALTLAVLIWRLGTGPFLDGLRTVNARALVAGAGLAVLTTVSCAWRWKVVAGGLRVRLPLSTAVAAYYRSLFLNLTIPGGVAGDVHRGVSHGRDVGDLGRGLRAVAWERFAGQVVQVLITVIVLILLPSPVRRRLPLLAIGIVLALLATVLLARVRDDGALSAWARLRRAATGDIRDGLLASRAWPRIALASGLVLGGHAATFLIAARTAGTVAPASRMLPIALLVLLAGVLPNVGGWGPREGVTAWAFSASGLHAERGVAAAVVYGVMVLFASLPGAAVLVVTWFRRPLRCERDQRLLRERPAHA